MPFGGGGRAQAAVKGSGMRRVPREMEVYTPTKPTAASITTAGEVTMDVGGKLGTVTGTGTGSLGPSALDSMQVIKGASTTATFLVPLVQNAGRIVYLRSLQRWDSTSNTTKNVNNIGLIPWSVRTNAADTSMHIVLVENQTTVQKRISAVFSDHTSGTTANSGGTGASEPWSHTDPGTTPVWLEYALDVPNGKALVRDIDGVLKPTADASITSTLGVFTCWEAFNTSATGWDPEMIMLNSGSVEGMVDPEIRYVNDFLRRGALAPIAMNGIPAKIKLVTQFSSHASLQTITGAQTGDLIIGFGYRIGVTALPTLGTGSPTAWTRTTPTPTAGQNTAGLMVAYKVAASSSETFGTWTNAAWTGYIILRRVDGGTWHIAGPTDTTSPAFPTAYKSNAASVTMTYPAMTLNNVDSTSVIIRIGAHTNASTTTTLPTGYNRILEVTQIGNGLIELLMNTGKGVSANPTLDNQTANSSSTSICTTLEVW